MTDQSTQQITEEAENQPAAKPESAAVAANLVIVSTQENKRARWYVVHTYSGHENKVAEMIKQRAETLNLTDKILEILIPIQDKIQIKRGQRKTVN